MKYIYKNLKTSRKIFAIILLLILFLGCSDTGTTTPDDTWADNKTKFDITWGSDVINFESADMSDIVKIDSSEFIFYFKNSNSKAASLQEGKIILIHDYIIRRVSSVSEENGQIVVETDLCTLEEAAKDADISWDYGIDLTPKNVIKSLKQNGYEVQQITLDSLGIQFKYKSYEINGWVKFLDKVTRIQLTIEKEVAGIKPAKMVVDGEIRRFRSKGMVKILGHKLQEYNAENSNQEGEFTVKVIAAGSGNDIGIEIPFPLVAGPLGIPFFTWEIKFLGVMNASVPAGASALLEEKFIWDADMGFKYIAKDKKAESFSTLKKQEIKSTGTQQHAAAAGVMQVAWGIAIPRFEVSFMGTTIAWFHTAYLLDGYYRFNPACQKIEANFYGAAGINVGLLTVSVYSKTWNLWKYNKPILKSGTCPD